jgi:hypothetical protein
MEMYVPCCKKLFLTELGVSMSDKQFSNYLSDVQSVSSGKDNSDLQ